MGGSKLSCPWIIEGRPCGTELVHDGLSKHIAGVHLRIMAQPCPYCEAKLSRGDARLRHLRRDCKKIPPEEAAHLQAQREYQYTCVSLRLC